MQDFMKHFKREQTGSGIPSGARIKVGTPFEGVDVGQLLEQEYARKFGDP
jgi:hypothetical protein